MALAAPTAWAATYTLPSGFGTAPFNGCALSSGTTYTCGAITIPNSSVVNITSSMTINAAGLTIGTSVTISVAQGVSATLATTSGNSIAVGSTASISANLVSLDNMTIGSGASIIGNLSAIGNSISLGSNATVVGNVTSDGQSFGAGSVVYGSCSSAAANCVTLTPLLDWHFDESAWNGTAGEVKDSSGRGRTGTAQGGATTTASGRDCAAGNFSGANNVTGGAMDLGIGGTSAFSFMAWVKWGTNPSTVNSWANIFSNNSNAASDTGVFWLQHNSSNSLYEVALKTTSNRGFIQSTTATAQGTWQHVAGVYDGATLKIYVNGVQEGSTNLTGTIQAHSSSYILNVGRWGFNNTPRWFTGQIDEVMAFGSALNATMIKAIYTYQSQSKNWNGSARSCAASGPDHIEVVHNGSAINCLPKAMTVLACTSAASCNGNSANQYNGSFNFTPGTIAGAQWCADAACASPISGATTLNNGAAIYLRQPTAGTTTLVATSTTANNSTVQCSNTTTTAFNAGSACAIAYSSAGFLMNAANHVSCTAQNITLQAVQSSATNNACVPAFQGVSRNVQLSSAFINPATGTKSASLSYVTTSGGASSSLAALSTNAGSPSTLSNLYFDNTGTARITNFLYPDVGQVSLSAQYSGSSATNDSGLTLSTVSGNTFVAAPAGFSFSTVSAPQTAGVPFNVTISAKNACATPATTPNFGQESTPASVTLTSSNPIPAMGNAIAIGQTLPGFTGGQATASLNWLEVGTFDLQAATTNYLASGQSASSTLAAVGRFIPARFDTVATPACNSFTYSGQPFTVKITAKANGVNGGTVTANYSGATWAKATTLSNASAVAGTLGLASVPASTFSQGVATASPTFTFTNPQTIPSTILLRALDTDGVSSQTGSEGSTSIASGRLRLLNVYGSDQLGLSMPLTAQIWNTNGYVLNAADNCTTVSVPTSGNGLAFGVPSLSGKAIPSLRGLTSGSATLLVGDGGLKFSAPGSGNYGYVDVTIAAPSWLQFPWKGAGNLSPTGRATFGIYKSPLIYRRENY